MSNLPAHEQRSLQSAPISPPARGRFEGVLNVVRFNWPLYLVGISVVALALLTAMLLQLPLWVRWILFAASAAAVYLLAASLVVSHWIYDRSPLYRFDWARQHAGRGVTHIVNLHSGFDESSPALRYLFPEATLDVMDIYDPVRMTEASIIRARRYQDRHVSQWLRALTRSIAPDALPSGDSTIGAIVVILAIHEVRRPEDRQRLFAEFNRALRPGGRLILLEHLRDPANFLAFGPQFVHFYSRRTWLDLARRAGLTIVHETRITPFIGLFVFEKPQANRS